MSSPDAPDLNAIEARATSDEEIDRDLMLYGFDPTDRYPEYGHNQMREAYQAGWDTARADTLTLVAALRAAETKLAAIRELCAARTSQTAFEVELILNGKGEPTT